LQDERPDRPLLPGTNGRCPSSWIARRSRRATFSEHGIQPIWLRITNDGGADLWFLPITVDADYYSADEAALAADVRKFFEGPYGVAR